MNVTKNAEDKEDTCSKDFTNGFPDVIIQKEIDIPFPGGIPNNEKKLSSSNVDKLEKLVGLVKNTQQIRLRDKAFTLVIALFIVLLFLYGTDVLLTNLNLKNSSLSTGIFEFVKISASTLFGFVFSNELRKDK